MPEGINTRAVFVDGPTGTGIWSLQPEAVQQYQQGAHCGIGGIVFFKWGAQTHDLVKMASQAHWEQCDFASSETLVPAGGEVDTMQSYSFACDSPGEVVYLACSLDGHCRAGQKARVSVSGAVRVHSDSGVTLLHQQSLARMLHMLNSPALDTGFSTEAQANSTLELIWCIEAHCPDSARDVDPMATVSSCRADVHNLAGYVSRSRPQPRYTKALEYYEEALAFDPAHCPTLEYRTELFLKTGNASAAVESALELCAACGPDGELVRQAQDAFAESLPDGFPTDRCNAMRPPPPPKTLNEGGEGGGGVSVGLVVGIAAGCTLFLGLVLCFLFCRRRPKSDGKTTSETHSM